MAVSYDLFLDWAKSYFGEDKIVYAKGGEEICVPTVFTADEKNHLWMNPSGGKSKHNPEWGSYRCWYTDKKGSLIGLVAQLEHIDWDDAEALISTETSLRSLEQKLNDFFMKKPSSEKSYSNVGKLNLPNNAYLIESMSRSTYYNRATNYLNSRKIPINGLYVGIGGKFDNRIIIPYYDENKELIWFNARTMSKDKKVIRYLKPDDEDVEGELEISQEEVLYMRKWPKSNQKIFVMEGEFDAMSLDLCGFYAAACGGKSLSESQIEILRKHTPVLSFDTDIHGKKALVNIGNDLLSKGFKEIFYVRPPEKYKDWNKFLQMQKPEIIKEYVNKYTKKYHSWSGNDILFQ